MSTRWILCGVVAMSVLTTACDRSEDGAPSPSKARSGAERYATISGVSRSGDVTIEWAGLFFNEQATQAAIEDGVIEPGEDLPNPMYVREVDGTATFRLTRRTRIVLLAFDQHGSPEPVRVSLHRFLDAYREGFPTSAWAGSANGYFRIRAEGGELTLLRQIYTI